jgi:hypothetical protein
MAARLPSSPSSRAEDDELMNMPAEWKAAFELIDAGDPTKIPAGFKLPWQPVSGDIITMAGSGMKVKVRVAAARELRKGPRRGGQRSGQRKA